PSGIYEVFKKNRIRQVAYVPDAGHAKLIRMCQADDQMVPVSLTTEEEGVALLGGAWLGGDKGVLLMQSSGVGNCINMLALPLSCGFPLLMIVTMRGDCGEFNPAQIPMGANTQAVFEAMGVIVKRADAAEDVVDTISAGMQLA